MKNIKPKTFIHSFAMLVLLSSCNPFFKPKYDASLGANQTADAAQTALVCPTGFVAVIGSGTYSTSDFCVMQFEAKNDGSNNAVSTALGTPYVSIGASVAGANNDAFEK